VQLPAGPHANKGLVWTSVSLANPAFRAVDSKRSRFGRYRLVPANVWDAFEAASRHARRQRVSGAQSLRLFAEPSVSAPLQA
jgi:hypothetical protein